MWAPVKHLRIKLRTANVWCKQTHGLMELVRIPQRVSEFNCLAVVLFSAMFSCFLLDSFELQEMVCLTKHGTTFSSLNISRRYDEHAYDTIFFYLCWKLKNLSLKLVASHFARSVRAVIVQLNGVLAIWPHKRAGKHMVRVNNCCLQFSNSRAVFESLFL